MSKTIKIHERVHRLSPVFSTGVSRHTPSISEQFQSISPDNDFCSYFTQKFEQLEKDYNNFANVVFDIKLQFQQQHQLELQLLERDAEIAQLQRALSDLQVAFLEERGEKMNAIAEKCNLQNMLDEYQDRLSQLSASANSSESKIDDNDNCRVYHHENYSNKSETSSLHKKIKAMELQLKEKERLHQQQIDVLKRDRDVLVGEMNAQQCRDAQHKNDLVDELTRVQEKIIDIMRRFLSHETQVISGEKEKLSQKTRICCNRPSYKSLLENVNGNVTNKHLKQGEQCENSYRRSCVSERQRCHSLCRCHSGCRKHSRLFQSCDKNNASGCPVLAEEQTKNDLLKEIADMKGKFEKLDRRRRLQIEGFQNDVKQLRSELSHIENELFKLFNNFHVGKGNSLRSSSHSSNGTTKLLQNVEGLKRNVQNLEDYLKFL